MRPAGFRDAGLIEAVAGGNEGGFLAAQVIEAGVVGLVTRHVVTRAVMFLAGLHGSGEHQFGVAVWHGHVIR